MPRSGPRHRRRRRRARDKVTFARDTGFHDEVKRRVLAYFERTGLSQRDSPRMYLKTAVLLLWFGASYALLVFAATTVWQGALLSAVAGARDGGHRLRHPARRQPRRLLEPRRRQRRDGDDARHAGRELVPLALQAQPLASHLHEPRGRGRRHQLRPLRAAVAGAAALPPAPPPAVLPVGAVLVLVPEVELRRRLQEPDAGANLRAAGSRDRAARRRSSSSRGKVVFFAWAFAVPLLFHPWWVVLLFYADDRRSCSAPPSPSCSCSPTAWRRRIFPSDRRGRIALPRPWAVHQVQTTVDFARRQSAADLVRGRAQLPDRAPPVSPHLPRPLPAHRGDRAGDVRRVRRSLHRPRELPRGARVPLALASPHGTAARERDLIATGRDREAMPRPARRRKGRSPSRPRTPALPRL